MAEAVELKAKLIQNGTNRTLTKAVLFETIKKYNSRWAEPSLTTVTPVVPHENLISSLEEPSATKAGQSLKAQGEKERCI